MDTDLNPKNNKTSNVTKISLLIFVFLLVGNISFYLTERSIWIYKGQPYPKATEWLLPANMVMVYGMALTKLPFVDERSWIMKPIIGLQDYFVSKWQENLPDDDAEKYLGWYIFRLKTYMVPNANSVVLYTGNTYSYEETRQANEKAWDIVEHMVKYQAQDEVFNEIRLTAFLNMAFFYVENASIYWYHEKKPEFELYTMNQQKNFFFDKQMMFDDTEKMQRFEKLFDYMQLMEDEYKEKRPNYYKENLDLFIQNTTMYKLTDYLLRYQLFQAKGKGFVEFCNEWDNVYLREHFAARKNLQHLYETGKERRQQSIESDFKDSIDNEVEKICKNTTKE